LLHPAQQLPLRNLTMQASGHQLAAAAEFSYSCSSLQLNAEQHKRMQFRLSVQRFQLQPFNGNNVFAPSFDCSSMLSLEQLISFVPVLLLTMIAILGVYQLLSVTPNDRFDTIKKKPLGLTSEQ